MSEEKLSVESLTARQREWLAHLTAWREHGGSLKEYARAHDLSVSGLYTAKRLLSKRGVWQRATRRRSVTSSPPTLVPVRLKAAMPTVSMIRIVLPNGIVVEVPEEADPVRCRALLACVAESLR